MIDGVGTLRYPCYMSIQTGTRPYYVHKIDSCPAEMNGDGFVTGADYALFHNVLFPAGDVRADLDADGSVTLTDAAAYNAAYAASGPP